MKSTKRRKSCTFWSSLFLLLIFCGLPGLYYAGRPLPIELRREIFTGIVYYRRVHIRPRLMVIHIVTVKLTTPGLHFLVTPGDPQASEPLTARTTSQFLDTYGASVAINGDGFHPWYSDGLLSYYPHIGDPVTPNGMAASEGVVYARGHTPVLFISADNRVSFNSPVGGIYNAISGDNMLVERGIPVEGLDDDTLAPRTAVGYDPGTQRLILMIIDGRQPWYSEGATMAELAELMVYYGANVAMSLDGGGSTTLVVRGLSGSRIMNSPIDSNIPGRERAIGNHLGIFAP